VPAPAPRRIIVLGSTGSIGTGAMDVLRALRSDRCSALRVVGLAAGRNAPLLAAQAREFEVESVAIAQHEGSDQELARRVFEGPDAALQLVEAVAQRGDLVLSAIVGAAGLAATLRAIEIGCDIALANKETLVAAGALVMPAARKHGVRLLPVDSEHCAVAQCLLAGRGTGEVRRIVLTASGGPFRVWPAERVEKATVEEALNHPTWTMGRKITIDSATMMNKALEVIEAHWLFGLPADRIEVLIHPQSIVHGFVEFVDGSVVAQLGPPDMRTPIQWALLGGERAEGPSRRLDLTQLSRLDFEPVQTARMPAVALARRVLAAGGTAGAILNAANEVAVEAFLAGRIPFGQIVRIVESALDAITPQSASDLSTVLAADAAARAFVRGRLPTPALAAPGALPT